jgi:hypothetical protein
VNVPDYPGSPLRRHGGAGRYLRGRGRGGRLGRAMIVIVGAIAELERSLIIERVRAGMRRANLEGRHIGRKPLNVDRQAVLRHRRWTVRRWSRLRVSACTSPSHPFHRH